MPRDANGVYSLPGGYLAVTGATIQASQHNPPLEDIGAALTGSLPTNGTAPMTAPLRLPDGTVGQPAVSFASDPTMGFYKNGNFIGATKPITGILPIGLGPLPWSRASTPAGWVLCYGQTLSRTAYPDLWAVAQAEIAAGNLFYNNGNGTDTFGIGDMRGRVVACDDDMGGSSAFRLTSAGSGIAGDTMGATGGAQNIILSPNQIPIITPSGSISSQSTQVQWTVRSDAPAGGSNTYVTQILSSGGSFSAVLPVTGASFSGSPFNPSGGQFHVNVQPTMIAAFILYAGA